MCDGLGKYLENTNDLTKNCLCCPTAGLEAAVHMIAVQKSYRLLDVKGKKHYD